MSPCRGRRRPFFVCPFLFSILIIPVFIPGTPAPAQEVDPNLWVPDGPVYAILASDSTIFVGGLFNYVGPKTNGAALLDATEGRVTPPIELTDGRISAIASDGSGGWYIGGAFSKVLGVPRSKLAHLRADVSVSDWNPGNGQLWNGEIRDLAIGDEVVYAAGDFTAIGSLSRNHLAAVDRATGAMTSWDPEVEGSVACIAIDGSTVYAGGSFSYVNGFPGLERNRLAAFDAQSGSATPWNPGASALVEVLLVHNGVLYAGGSGAIGFVDFLAAFDLQTGETLPGMPKFREVESGHSPPGARTSMPADLSALSKAMAEQASPRSTSQRPM